MIESGLKPTFTFKRPNGEVFECSRDQITAGWNSRLHTPDCLVKVPGSQEWVGICEFLGIPGPTAEQPTDQASSPPPAPETTEAEKIPFFEQPVVHNLLTAVMIGAFLAMWKGCSR